MKTLLPLALLYIALGSSSGLAQQLRTPQMDVSHEVKLPQLTQQASLIVEGRPVAFRSFWNREHTAIYTATTIEVYKVFKGEVTGSTVELITYGGWVGETGMSSTTNIKLDDHTVGLFFLKPSQQPSEGSTLASTQVSELVYGQQGFIRYSGDQAVQYAAFSKFRVYPDIEKSLYTSLQQEAGKAYRTKKAFDVTHYDQVQERLTGVDAATKTIPTVPIDTKKKSSANPNSGLARPQAVGITGFSSPATTAGTFIPFTIYGSGFRNPAQPLQKPVVQFRNAESFAGGPLYMTCPAVNIQSFTDTEITLVGVPSNDGGSMGNDPNGNGAGSGFVRVTSSNGTAQSPQE